MPSIFSEDTQDETLTSGNSWRDSTLTKDTSYSSSPQDISKGDSHWTDTSLQDKNLHDDNEIIRMIRALKIKQNGSNKSYYLALFKKELIEFNLKKKCASKISLRVPFEKINMRILFGNTHECPVSSSKKLHKCTGGATIQIIDEHSQNHVYIITCNKSAKEFVQLYNSLKNRNKTLHNRSATDKTTHYTSVQ